MNLNVCPINGFPNLINYNIIYTIEQAKKLIDDGAIIQEKRRIDFPSFTLKRLIASKYVELYQGALGMFTNFREKNNE